MPRKICEKCHRPISVCICEHLVSLMAPCDIIILQHPSEQKQALATVPILQACLSNLTVLVGEAFSDHPEVIQLCLRPEDSVVVFPTEAAQQWSLKGAAINDGVSTHGAQRKPNTLIVLDGTWRKAKLMWHKNPWLHELNTVMLSDIPDSQYVIRSSSIKGGVSTLEAVMYSCNYLSNSDRYMPLLKPFKAMIDWQIKKMGKKTFFAHYGQSDN
jgi:DTW domain-containing protein YfiP